MRLIADSGEAAKSMEQRLFEAYHDGSSMWLTAQDVRSLVNDRHISAQITDRASFEVGIALTGLYEGLIGSFGILETWNEFKGRVAVSVRRSRTLVFSVTDVNTGERHAEGITITPEVYGVSLQHKGTGLCEVVNGSAVYAEFFEGVPRLVVWPDINCPDGRVISLEAAMEDKRTTTEDTDNQSNHDWYYNPPYDTVVGSSD